MSATGAPEWRICIVTQSLPADFQPATRSRKTMGFGVLLDDKAVRLGQTWHVHLGGSPTYPTTGQSSGPMPGEQQTTSPWLRGQSSILPRRCSRHLVCKRLSGLLRDFLTKG